LTKVKTLLLTRPEAQSRALAKDIDTIFPDTARCIISPLLEIAPAGALPDLAAFQALIFTSVNGVQAYVGLSGPIGLRAFCVGARTAKVAGDAGLQAVSADGGAKDVVALVQSQLAPDGGAVLHIRGEHVAGEIAMSLRGVGFSVEEAVLYQQVAQGLTETARAALANGEIDVLPLYSPRTAETLLTEISNNPDWPIGQITAICISENVAKAVHTAGFGGVDIAAGPNGAEMLSAIGRFLR